MATATAAHNAPQHIFSKMTTIRLLMSFVKPQEDTASPFYDFFYSLDNELLFRKRKISLRKAMQEFRLYVNKCRRSEQNDLPKGIYEKLLEVLKYLILNQEAGDYTKEINWLLPKLALLATELPVPEAILEAALKSNSEEAGFCGQVNLIIAAQHALNTEREKAEIARKTALNSLQSYNVTVSREYKEVHESLGVIQTQVGRGEQEVAKKKSECEQKKSKANTDLLAIQAAKNSKANERLLEPVSVVLRGVKLKAAESAQLSQAQLEKFKKEKSAVIAGKSKLIENFPLNIKLRNRQAELKKAQRDSKNAGHWSEGNAHVPSWQNGPSDADEPVWISDDEAREIASARIPQIRKEIQAFEKSLSESDEFARLKNEIKQAEVEINSAESRHLLIVQFQEQISTLESKLTRIAESADIGTKLNLIHALLIELKALKDILPDSQNNDETRRLREALIKLLAPERMEQIEKTLAAINIDVLTNEINEAHVKEVVELQATLKQVTQELNSVDEQLNRVHIFKTTLGTLIKNFSAFAGEENYQRKFDLAKIILEGMRNLSSIIPLQREGQVAELTTAMWQEVGPALKMLTEKLQNQSNTIALIQRALPTIKRISKALGDEILGVEIYRQINSDLDTLNASLQPPSAPAIPHEEKEAKAKAEEAATEMVTSPSAPETEAKDQVQVVVPGLIFDENGKPVEVFVPAAAPVQCASYAMSLTLSAASASSPVQNSSSAPYSSYAPPAANSSSSLFVSNLSPAFFAGSAASQQNASSGSEEGMLSAIQHLPSPPDGKEAKKDEAKTVDGERLEGEEEIEGREGVSRAVVMAT
ncbi:MAG: hypothetical protein M1561_07215 [Gammaproteobacteria bacterium]|nr:hypothetical protein [Gammaproteobacteria bacterium]